MRRLLLVTVLLLLANLSEAQMVAGAGLGLTTTTEKVDGDKQVQTFGFDVAPSVGYVIGDWEFGAVFEYSHNKIENYSSNTTETDAYYALGAYANYCFSNIGKFFFSIEACPKFGFTDGERVVDLQVLPLVTYEINDRWDVDLFSDVLSLNYLWTKTEDDDMTVSTLKFMSNDGNLFGLSFSYKF